MSFKHSNPSDNNSYHPSVQHIRAANGKLRPCGLARFGKQIQKKRRDALRTERPRFRCESEVRKSGNALYQLTVFQIATSTAYSLTTGRLMNREFTRTYSCRKCKNMNKHTAVPEYGYDFLAIPAKMSHSCTSVPTGLQERRRDTGSNHLPAQRYWRKVVGKMERMSWGDEPQFPRVHFTRYSLLQTRTNENKKVLNAAQGRCFTAVLRNKHLAQLDNVPDNLRFRADKTTFLQHTEYMHICFLQEITKAVNCSHWLPTACISLIQEPSVRHPYGAPPLCCDSAQEDYLTIFGKMKEASQAVPSETPSAEPELRTAVNSAIAISAYLDRGRRCHLMQAWVRNRNKLARAVVGGEH
ncbi:hypothetical protein Aduo_001431 [Ancylostoma duodenale]